MAIRAKDNERHTLDTSKVENEAQLKKLEDKFFKFTDWEYHNFEPNEKGGMKVVSDLLNKHQLSHHYNTLVNMNATIDYTHLNNSQNNEPKDQQNNTDTLKCIVANNNSSDDKSVCIQCRVTPNAKATEIAKIDKNDEWMEVRLNAKPKDGEANTELCRFIAEKFKVAKSNVSLKSGHKSRNKVVCIRDVTLQQVTKLLSLT
ncbi:hypothetical protein RFI_32772 [Reticulomyxa filosa]|uniref:Uncharacterized protein n=1 Tax=Reticulomyxa filosa TaxID=46433 RepID=X6LU11_RETFI|nr:hypothetical protein RFI_32772 [Reticulomyxa filosa]|eukprot:ETO04627.1 hypothetical protein RFI_32772 [Reticulomyxa filosa]